MIPTATHSPTVTSERGKQAESACKSRGGAGRGRYHFVLAPKKRFMPVGPHWEGKYEPTANAREGDRATIDGWILQAPLNIYLTRPPDGSLLLVSPPFCPSVTRLDGSFVLHSQYLYTWRMLFWVVGGGAVMVAFIIAVLQGSLRISLLMALSIIMVVLQVWHDGTHTQNSERAQSCFLLFWPSSRVLKGFFCFVFCTRRIVCELA